MMGGPGYGMMGFMSGFGIIFVLAYVAIVVYAMYLLTQISRSLQRIAASLEHPRPPQNSKTDL